MFLPHRLLEMRASQGTWEGIILSWSVKFAPEYEKCRTKDKTWKLNFIPVYNMWILKKKKKLCACLKSLQGCTTLSDTMDCSPPGNSVCGILQARVLEWAAMSSSRGHLRDLGIKTVPCISYTAGWFFTTEPPQKPSQKRWNMWKC